MNVRTGLQTPSSSGMAEGLRQMYQVQQPLQPQHLREKYLEKNNSSATRKQKTPRQKFPKKLENWRGIFLPKISYL